MIERFKCRLDVPLPFCWCVTCGINSLILGERFARASVYSAGLPLASSGHNEGRAHHVETVGFALPEATPGTLLPGAWDELVTPCRFQR